MKFPYHEMTSNPKAMSKFCILACRGTSLYNHGIMACHQLNGSLGQLNHWKYNPNLGEHNYIFTRLYKQTFLFVACLMLNYPEH